MADFVAVLKKTIDGMADNTPPMRERVYEKARSTVAAKLAAINPPPPQSVIDRQKAGLEDAIRAVEAEYSAPPPPPEPEIDELEDVFASLSFDRSPTPQPVARQPAPPLARPAPPPAPSVAARDLPRAAELETRDRAASDDFGDRPFAADEDHYSSLDRDRQDNSSYSDDDDQIGTPPPLDQWREARPAPDSRRLQAKPMRRRSSFPTGLVTALVVLLVLAGGGYAVWTSRDAIKEMASSMIASGTTNTSTATNASAPVTPAPNAPQPSSAPAPTEQAAVPATSGSEDAPKFTQRLNADGSEVDPGRADETASVGEGTSVAAATVAEAAPVGQPQAAPGAATNNATAPAAANNGDVAVGQRAIFYEERTTSAAGSAQGGSVVWSVVQESPGGDLPPEPAIRGEATIPGKDVQLRMTIRRNADKTLPASHIIEMIFLTPDGFEGGGIDNVLRVTMKESEQATGSQLLGIPAKIADGFFLVALSDTPAETQANLNLLGRQSWIDVPIVYKNGRRALITVEKGIPGERVFADALKAWQTASAG